MSLERVKDLRWPLSNPGTASGPPDAQDPSHRPYGATLGASSAHGFIRCSGRHQGGILRPEVEGQSLRIAPEGKEKPS